jgi:putative heme transporter
VPRSQVSVKTLITVFLGLAFSVALGFVVVRSRIAITLSVAAALVAVALDHGVGALQRLRFGRAVAIATVMTALIAALVGLAFVVIPPAVRQVRDLVEQAPQLVQTLRGNGAFRWLDQRFGLQAQLQEATASPTSAPAPIEPLLKAAGGVLAAVGGVVTVLFLVVFMLGWGGRMVRGLLAEALPDHRERYERVLGKIYQSIGGYLSGLTLIAALNAAVTSAFLAIVGVPFFLPLGILSGLGSFVPLVGATVAGTLISLIALASGGVWLGVACAAYYIAYQQFENHLVVPVVYRRTVALNPLVTILGLLFLAELAGLLGALLAVPVLAALQIIVRELLVLRRERLNVPLKGEVRPPTPDDPPPRRRLHREPRHA